MIILQNNRKAYVNALKDNWTLQNCRKGCPKASKMAIFDKKQVFRLKSLEKSKIFNLVSSFRAKNTQHAMHLMMHEFTKNFFSKFGCQEPLG